MLFRLSQKLSAKLGEEGLKPLPLDDNPFADWSCHLFLADRTKYVLVSNPRSLYSAVFYGRGVTSGGQFIQRALATLRDVLEVDGQQFIYERFVAPASARVRFAKSLKRSVAGSMNELILHAQRELTGGEVSPFDVSFMLNDILLSYLARNPQEGYRRPREAFKELIDIYRP